MVHGLVISTPPVANAAKGIDPQSWGSLLAGVVVDPSLHLLTHFGPNFFVVSLYGAGPSEVA